MALVAAPVVHGLCRGGDNAVAAARHQIKDVKKTRRPTKSSSIDDPRFVEGYHAAYATIYDRHDYAAAIEQLKALGHDDSAAVANLIGYSYRKLGDYKVSQIWYERALKADPNHVKTWQYYGLWQLEQGNREQAQYHLNRIAALRRHRQRGISLAGRGTGKAARHRPGLLNSATPIQPAQLQGAPVLFYRDTIELAGFVLSDTIPNTSRIDQLRPDILGARVWSHGCNPRSNTSATGSNSSCGLRSSPAASSRSPIAARWSPNTRSATPTSPPAKS